MYQLTQLADHRQHEWLANAQAQRPAQRCSRWPGPPAAPNAPNGGCAAPPAPPGGCAPSSRPRPPTTNNSRRQPQAASPTTTRRSP